MTSRWTRFKDLSKTMIVRGAGVVVVVATAQHVLSQRDRAHRAVLRDDLDRMRHTNHDLAQDVARLRMEVVAVKTDDRYLERVARDEFGMIRRGETLYQFIEPKRRLATSEQ